MPSTISRQFAKFRDECFSIENWFDALRADLGKPSTHDAAWPPTVRRFILEALSDAAAEQFLNPIVANHLRLFGGNVVEKHGMSPERMFWVRSEWEKIDLSYGLALPFTPTSVGWEQAWRAGTSGELGQVEAKVCYAHLRTADLKGQIKKLSRQLKARRAYDLWQKSPHREKLRYHGLVWLFQHGGVDELEDVGEMLLEDVEDLGLTVSRKFDVPTPPDDLGRLWPAKASYQCGLSVALVELEHSR